MTEVIFVEVTASRMEMRTCEIAERTYAQGISLQIIAANQEQAARLDELLWSFRPDSFVPHGLYQGDQNEPSQPVAITHVTERVSGIEGLIMMDYCPVDLVKQFSQAIHLVVVDNPERLEASRRYWTQLKDAGFTMKHQKH
jgi:DNA polymerase-3 subunit chi